MVAPTAFDLFARAVALPDEELDLARCALLTAACADPFVNVDDGLAHLDSLAEGGRNLVAAADGPLAQVNALNEYLFDTVGFSGNEADYYDPRNSLLDQVLKRKVGIPISLSLVYIETGARLGVPLAGVGMPGHFLVRHEGEDSLFIDPFHRGVMLSERECAERLKQISDSVRWNSSFLEPIGKRAFLARMLRNLGAIWAHREELNKAVDVLSMLIALQPGEPGHHRDRGVLRQRMGQKSLALQDLEYYLTNENSGPDAWFIRRMVDGIHESGIL
jgi:regulator of sirC expression with transglutaminase-like and TPR domain